MRGEDPDRHVHDQRDADDHPEEGPQARRQVALRAERREDVEAGRDDPGEEEQAQLGASSRAGRTYGALAGGGAGARRVSRHGSTVALRWTGFTRQLKEARRSVGQSTSSFGPERFTSRELSRLEFGARLLDLAEDRSLPLLERCKFVAIFADMVDEFFQVRVVSLEDKVAAGVQTASVDGMRPRQQLVAIRERVISLVERQDRLVLDALLPELAAGGIAIVPLVADLDDAERKTLTEYFDEHVYPILTPLAVDPGHPFPMISNLSLNIAVNVRRRDDRRGAQRPREGPELAAALPARRRTDRLVPARGPHHGQPRPALPGHDHRSRRPLPGDAKRRPHARRGRGRRPARRPRGGAAPPALRRGAARRDPERDDAASSSTSWSTSSTSTRPTSTSPTPRWGCTTCGASTRSTAPTSRARAGRRSPRRACWTATTSATSSPRSARATSCCTTRTTRSPTRSRPSSPRPPTTPRSSGIKMTLYRTSGDSPIVESLIRAAEQRQAGRRAGRAQGPLRRGGQHRVGQGARRRGRPRRLRHRGAQDPLQDRARAAQRGRRRRRATSTWRPATTTTRPRASTRTSAC